jgi:hypothetical protein
VLSGFAREIICPRDNFGARAGILSTLLSELSVWIASIIGVTNSLDFNFSIITKTQASLVSTNTSIHVNLPFDIQT